MSLPDIAAVKRETRRNVLVQIAATGLGKVFGLLSTIFLGRLLVPEDFGIVAIVGAFLGYVLLTSDFGLVEALIQRRDRVAEAADVLFLSRPLLGGLQFAVAVLLAPLVADLFGDPRLIDALRVASLVILIDSFSSVPSALLAKELRVRRVTTIALVSGVVQSAVAIVLAYKGFSYWSMIYNTLVSSTLITFLLWREVEYRPTLRFDLGLAREMFGFGNFVVLSQVLVFLFLSTDNLVVGGLFGIGVLGLYVMAFRFGYYPASVLSAAADHLVFPAFSALATSPDQLRRAYQKTLRYVALLALPFATVLAVTATDFLVVVVGDRWIASAGLLRILAWEGLFVSLSAGCQPAFYSVGNPRAWSLAAGARLGVAVVLLIPLAYAFGVSGVALAFAVAAAVGTAIAVRRVNARLGITTRETFEEIKRPALASVASAGAMLAAYASVMALSVTLTSSSWMRAFVNLGVVGAIGIAAYLVTLQVVLKDTALQEVRQDFSPLRSNRVSSEAPPSSRR